MGLERFTTLTQPFLHLIAADGLAFQQIFDTGSKDDFQSIMIEGNKCTDVDKLFIEFAHKLSFPDYFGENWSAFDECINDLSWMERKGYVLFISHINQVLLSDREDFKIFMDILYSTCEEWSSGRDYDTFPVLPTPFHIALHCNLDAVDQTVERLSFAGIHSIDVMDTRIL